jgi:hypothetical protein
LRPDPRPDAYPRVAWSEISDECGERCTRSVWWAHVNRMVFQQGRSPRATRLVGGRFATHAPHMRPFGHDTRGVARSWKRFDSTRRACAREWGSHLRSALGAKTEEVKKLLGPIPRSRRFVSCFNECSDARPRASCDSRVTRRRASSRGTSHARASFRRQQMPPPPKQKPPTAGGPGVSTPGVVGRGRDLAKIGSKNAGPGPPKPRLPLPAKASAVVKPSLASEACVALDMCVFGSKSRRTARASVVTAKTNVPVGRTKTSGPTLFPSATKKLNLTTQPAPAPSDTHEETSRDDRDAFSFQEHLGNTVSEETLDDQHDLDDAVVTSDVASPNGSASDAPGPKISNWRLARRAVFTHAYFREVREIGRDVGWSLLLGVVGDKKNAGDWLARNKKSPFAASARRENSRRNDRGRVILDEEKICDNTQTVGTSRVTMDSNHMSNTACLLRSAQKVSADWRVCRTESEVRIGTFPNPNNYTRHKCTVLSLSW